MFPFMQNQAPIGQYPNGTWSNINSPVAHNSPLQNNLNVNNLLLYFLYKLLLFKIIIYLLIHIQAFQYKRRSTA